MLIIGIPGKTLTDDDRIWLSAKQVSGVILFARNFANRDQVTSLIDDIRMERPDDPFLICVDQEGGPVQRMRGDFTKLPALAQLGVLFDSNPKLAISLAEEHAWLMASEMRAIDIDLSFAPVADLARGNMAIGERAFHADPAVTFGPQQTFNPFHFTPPAEPLQPDADTLLLLHFDNDMGAATPTGKVSARVGK